MTAKQQWGPHDAPTQAIKDENLHEKNKLANIEVILIASTLEHLTKVPPTSPELVYLDSWRSLCRFKRPP